MDLLTRAEFEKLAAPAEGVHVSLFMPTHRVGNGRESDADRLQWKNMLTAVESTLVEDGMPKGEAADLLAPAWDLHGDGMAWSHMADGLAAFLRAGEMSTFRVPVEMPQLAAVGNGFVIGPTLPLLTDQTFLVLALSQKNVRVLRGSRDRIGELDLPDVPSAFEDVFEKEGPQSDSVPRPNASGRVSGGAVYYGSSSLDNVHKEDVVEFFREVADGVHRYISGRTIPMVLAGLPEWVAVYRDVTRYPHVLDEAVEHNPDAMSADQLREAAWELVSHRLSTEAARLIDRLEEQRGHGSGATGAEEVLTAANEGRVDTLLITPEGCWGNGSGTEVVRLGGVAEDPCELVDVAAMQTLRTGGAVRVVDELPGGVPAAAVLRY